MIRILNLYHKRTKVINRRIKVKGVEDKELLFSSNESLYYRDKSSQRNIKARQEWSVHNFKL